MTDTVHVTFFKDAFASSYTTADLTLEELQTRILNATAPSKADLPWLKLAMFGKKKTKSVGKTGGSLRHDANLEKITGAELDYDGEEVGFDQALEMVKAMHIKAIVYTSPSHTAATPRWRILVPCSQPSDPALRAKLVARMNGFMKGILANKRESFTLSQAYYYGRALDNSSANHMAVVLDGEYIDLRNDLYKYQKDGMSGNEDDTTEANPYSQAADDADAARPNFKDGIHGFDTILSEIGDGQDGKGFNDVITRAVASYVGLHNGHPFDHDKLKKLLRKAIEDAPKKASRNHKDIPRYLSDRYLDDCIASAIRKFTETLPITINDFIAYLPSGEYIFIMTRMTWVAKSINNRIPPVPKLDKQGRPMMNLKKGTARVIKPTDWLDKFNAAEQMTWAPGEPFLIKNRLLIEGAGWTKRKGTQTINLYIPPELQPGDPNDVMPWTSHIERIYPDDAEHIIRWLAHRVQFPGFKINHALMLGGGQGIGKDTMLEPVKRAIGYSNFREVNPSIMLGTFNSYLRSVILRINEVRDLGETSRFTFYEHLKNLCAAPPDTLRVNEKNIKEHDIINCCGVIMTTNHKTDGIYLPADDRRTYVAWSKCLKEEFTAKYWVDLWEWYDRGGDRNVMAYLANLDISKFNAKAPPPQTAAFKAIVNSNRGDGESELADALDVLGNPPAVTIAQIEEVADPDFATWMGERKNRKPLSHRLESLGYDGINNPDAKDGLWVIMRKRQSIYALVSLGLGAQINACRELVQRIENVAKNPNSPNNSTIHPFRRPKK